MQQTIFALLTDPTSRQNTQIEASLSEMFSAGKFWFSKQVK